MRIFGYEITKAKKPTGRNKLIANLMYPMHYGQGLLPESNFESFMKAYRGWVYVCASKNALSAASIPLRLYVGKPNSSQIRSHKTKKITRKKEKYIRDNSALSQLPQVRKAVEIEEVLDHPLLNLMRNVNNFMNYFALFEMTNLFQELCGNAYWYLIEDRFGIPQEIWPMPPQNMRIVPDRVSFIKNYIFMKGFEKVEFPEPQVIHFKFPSPTNLYYGRGPLAAVTDEYNISININRYENFVFANMGRIEGAFQTENELSQYEFDRLKEEIRQTFRGIENVGKSPLLEKGVTYKPFGLAPKELAFMQGRKAIKEAIVNAYGQSMGLYDKDATRANAEVASFTHMKDTIRPRLVRMEEKLNEKLTPKFDEKLFVSFDDPVPIDKEHRLKEKESHLKTGYSSINMEREVDNKDSVEWGDEPILNQNLVPFSERQQGGNGANPPDNPDEEMSFFLKNGIDKISERLAEATMKMIKNNTMEG